MKKKLRERFSEKRRREKGWEGGDGMVVDDSPWEINDRKTEREKK